MRVIYGWIFFLFIFFIELNSGLQESPQFNVTVQVVGLPSLVIESPMNHTYFSNESIILNVSSNADNLWYNLNNGANISFVNYTFLNASEGANNVYVFANNSYGVSKKNASFFVDLNLFRVIYNEYKGLTKGKSTNFNSFSYEEVQSLNWVVLENTNFGKISFFENINLTDDKNFSDKILDLDYNTEISFNRIEVITGELKNFNKNAAISLYGLSFSNPKILKNGVECSLEECILISYFGGNLTFNASGLGTFIIQEIIQSTPNQNTGGSGGGGGGSGIQNVLNRKDFILDRDRMFVTLVQGEAKRESIEIENTGESELNISLIIDDSIREFIRTSTESLILKKGEKKNLLLDFIALEQHNAGDYLGKIMFSSGNVDKEILVNIEVESRNPLFDVLISIPDEFLSIKAGKEIAAEVSLVNLERVGTVDVEIKYNIIDEEGNAILEEHETVAVETKANFIKRFKIPEDAKAGIYVIYAGVSYDGRTGSSSASFRVVNFKYPLILAIFSAVVILLALIKLYQESRKRKIASKLLAEIKG